MSKALDSWDDQPTLAPANIASTSTKPGSFKPRIPKPAAVRDDWEDDDDDNEADLPVTEEQNKQIWEDANTREHHPMPSVVLVRGGSSAPSSAVVSPSLPLNQPPPMRILKRPSPALSPPQSGDPNTTNTAALQAEALKMREKKYQEARERIFGSSNGSNTDVSQAHSNTPLNDNAKANNQSGKDIQFSGKKSRSPNPTSPPSTQIIREPRGPREGQNAAGFGARRMGPTSVSPLADDQALPEQSVATS
ncbi:hypothetical protein CVT24_009199 [Panaeolus cyanescens]|uniref:SUZ domain-containing protein n=1 Tax=Panaeolus cyanescens TaxID=181874 RepID=A0A409Y8U4_9AGAR|nr:hypothetical protein CVT24_009199 [Panaeolus cyanescens]